MVRKGMNKLTREGIKAIQQGDPNTGRQLLEKAVKDEPDNAAAWQMLAAVVPDEAEKRRCLWRALESDPQHPSAMSDLAVLDGLRRPPPRTAVGTPSTIPSRTTTSSSGGSTTAPPDEQAHPSATPWSAKSSAGAGVAAGLAAAMAAGRRTSSGSTAAPGLATDATGGALRSTLTADDAVAIAEQQRRSAMPSPAAPPSRQRSMAALLIAGALCAGILAGLAGRYLGTGTFSDAESGGSARTGALGPGAAATVVTTPYGLFPVPGTAYLSGPGPDGAEAQGQTVVPLWQDPGETSEAPTCALPYGSAVLVLDVWTGIDGRRAFKVQHRVCTGWAAESHLSNAPGRPLSTPARDPRLPLGK